MKTAVIYYSRHHGNTKKVLDAIARGRDVTLIDAAETHSAPLEDYDLIGFASGIYYSKFQKSVLQFAEEHLPEGKKVFFVYTCGAEKPTYTGAIRKIAAEKHAEILGEFGCPGYDTFGPFKLVGGIAKGRPNQGDLSDAVRFFEQITE
ncbi:flavodoxin family protein [Dysosmobacter sp.]|uniref:flavodoxin family protein n=1 Tax=Dysosmobacter sp. TaxID=2591382 RepID=UPI002A8BEFA2|nr:flavodoxin family protein [Dysosmobacter sp.]MDY3282723.1 flavodoxin family protein [Dysosmobacter sp.]